MELGADDQRRLRGTLAKLFRELKVSELIAHEARLELSRINFDVAPDVRWFAVVQEAVRRGQVLGLLVAARRRDWRDPTLRALHESLSPGTSAVGDTVLPAGSLDLAARQRLVFDLIERQAPLEEAHRIARASGIAVPTSRDAGTCWATLLRELTLRNLDLSAVYEAAGVPAPASGPV